MDTDFAFQPKLINTTKCTAYGSISGQIEIGLCHLTVPKTEQSMEYTYTYTQRSNKCYPIEFHGFEHSLTRKPVFI